MVKAIAAGFPQKEIADAAYQFQREFDAGEREIVGVNVYEDADEELTHPAARGLRGVEAATPVAPGAHARGARSGARCGGAWRGCATCRRGPARPRRT